MVTHSIFDILNSSGIKYAIWKDITTTEEACERNTPPGRDHVIEYDLYVDRSCLGRFHRIVGSNGFTKSKTFVVSFPFVEHFYSFECGSWIHLNVYSRFITGESQTKLYDLPFTPNWTRISTRGNVRVLDNADYLALFLVRYFLKHGSIISIIVYYLDGASNSKEKDYCHESLTSFHFTDPLFEKLREYFIKGDPISFFKGIVYVKSRLFFCKRLSLIKGYLFRLTTLLKRIVNKLLIRRKRSLGVSGGAIVAVVGTDGSGKSSVVDFLVRRYRIFDHVSVSIGRIDSMISWLSLFSKLDKTPKHTSRSPFSQTYFFAGKALLLALVRLYTLGRCSIYRSLGYMVFLDRYPSQNIGGQDGPRIACQNKIFSLLSSVERFIYQLTPRPDLVFRLNVSLDNALKRNSSRVKKNKESDSEIVDRHKTFLLSDFGNCDICEVDADKDLDLVVEMVNKKFQIYVS